MISVDAVPGGGAVSSAGPNGSGPQELSGLCVAPGCSLRQGLECIDKNGKRIVLVTDAEQQLLGIVTDGDARRAILQGRSLDTTLGDILEAKKHSRFAHPVTAAVGATLEELLQLMHQHGIAHLPLVGDGGRVVGLATMDDLVPGQQLPMEAVIMAGGFGTRLRPLTVDLPKPMLPVGDRPLMELIVQQLQTAGIRRVNVTTHYMAEKIIEHFGDGQRFGVELNYVSEDRPLGTAGAIGLLEAPEEMLLVVNGDILTRVDFRAMLAYHKEHTAALTVGVRKYDLKVPYGVVESEGALIRRVVEKPSVGFFVNAGIYLLEPAVHRYIPKGHRFDMTDLIERLIQEGLPVASFPILEYWLDIGKHVDYEQAQQDVKAWRQVA